MIEKNVEFEMEEVDVEEFAKQGRRPPHARQYRIRIDREKYVVSHPIVNSAELLALVGKSPDKWRIHQKLRGGQMNEVKPGENVDLRECGVERFVTMELAQQDGEVEVQEALVARRTFRLPEEDEDYLGSLGLYWETIQDGGAMWVLLHDHQVPDGFKPQKAILAIRIEGGYPPAKLDMVYFRPAILRSNGKAIPAISNQQIDGTEFQRWSRHYEWREGIDSLATHHLRIKQWLADELER